MDTSGQNSMHLQPKMSGANIRLGPSLSCGQWHCTALLCSRNLPHLCVPSCRARRPTQPWDLPSSSANKACDLLYPSSHPPSWDYPIFCCVSWPLPRELIAMLSRFDGDNLGVRCLRGRSA
ncbi:hypothetical protein BD289DRAFT_423350 [Coniella lustricola]|uniref:Uncharacterized protein n=1 Tax=Coniella lustricola TaxID=2025994 RepID=A0A2T3AJR7_9PEZI|nr:hypothetical protein BD289DRAFT_423350 [Coniella lustricola]